MKYLNKKNYQDIKIVTKKCFYRSFKRKKIPFREIIIKKV